MNYLKYVGLLIFIFSVLAACQNNTKKTEEAVEHTNSSAETALEKPQEDKAETSDSKDEEETTETTEKTDDKNLQAITAKIDEVKSYKAELNLTATLDDLNEENLDAEVDIVNGDPPQIRLKSGGEERTVSRDGQTYFYNGTDWINVSESVDANLLYSVTYNQAVSALEAMSESLEVHEKDGKLIYEYQGDNLDIYRNLEALIQVNFGQIALESVETNVKFIIDDKEKRIEEITFDVNGTDSEGTFSIEGQTRFSNFNEIEEIELPQ